MKPTIVLVGRPNVGKSTLFNRLTRSKDALVADMPGLTRDRHYGQGRVGDKPYLLVDTGGFEPVIDEGILFEMAKQTLQAVDEADAVIFIADARTGLNPQDTLIAHRLRQIRAPLYLVINKAEGLNSDIVAAEFYELGLGEPAIISATHGDGVHALMDKILNTLPETSEEPFIAHPCFAVVGRPNVGKSTLVNAILGEDRVITFDQAGTTRDAIRIEFENDGKPYSIIDTAGIRRRGKVNDAIEKFSVIKTLQSIEDANVIVLVLDASQDIAEQDANIAGYALEAGRALVVVINKWDIIDDDRKDKLKQEINRKLYFLDFAKFHYICALKQQGIKSLFQSIQAAYQAATIKMPTPKITRVLQAAIERQQPPRVGLIRPKMRYAHQGGMNPPVIVIHGNALQKIKESYTRYLIQTFRKAFLLEGTPLRIQYQSNENPFIDNKSKVNSQPNTPRRAVLSARIAKKETQKYKKNKNKVSIKKTHKA